MAYQPTTLAATSSGDYHSLTNLLETQKQLYEQETSRQNTKKTLNKMLTTEINIKLQYQKAIVANMCSPLNSSKAVYTSLREFLLSYLHDLNELLNLIDEKSPFDVNTHCQRLLVQLVCAEKSHVNQKTQRYRAEKKQKQSILAMKSFCQLQRQVLEQIQLAIEHGKVEIIEAEYRPFIKELQKYLDDILPQPEDYLCSICLCVYYLPITLTTCRHTFCKSCLKLYMSRKIENLKEAEYQEFTSQHQSTSLFSSNCTLVDQPTPHPPLFDCPVCRTAFDTTTYQTDVALDNLLSLYFPEEQKQRRVDTLGLFSTWWTSAFLKYPPKTKKRSKKVDRDMKDFQCSFRSSHPILHLLFGNQMWGVYRENLTNGQQRRSSHSRFMSAEETAYYNDLTLAQGMVFLSV